MAPRDRQRFRERFRREPRVEANGGGGERKLMKIRDLSRHAAPLRQIVRKLTFDRILFSTEPRPATLSVDQLPLKALIKVLIRFPLNGGGGGGSSVSWPVVGQEFLLFVRACAFLLWEKILGRFYFRMVFNDEIITE